jgi:isoleucyl-tRNA synthetase
VREIRGVVTGVLEGARRDGMIGASLQASPRLALPEADAGLLDADGWAEVCITSTVTLETAAETPVAVAQVAPGAKCDRCWRVLPEVGFSAAHPTLCRRCEAVVEGQ